MNAEGESVIVNLKNVIAFGNGLIFEHDSAVENSEKGFELGTHQDFILELDHPNLFDNVKLPSKFLPKINPHKSKERTTWHQNWLEPTGESFIVVLTRKLAEPFLNFCRVKILKIILKR